MNRALLCMHCFNKKGQGGILEQKVCLTTFIKIRIQVFFSKIQKMHRMFWNEWIFKNVLFFAWVLFIHFRPFLFSTYIFIHGGSRPAQIYSMRLTFSRNQMICIYKKEIKIINSFEFFHNYILCVQLNDYHYIN